MNNDQENPVQFGLGDVVRHFRKRRNLSIHELADQSGTSVTMIEKLEEGVSDPPLTDVVKVVKTLGFDLWEAYQQLEATHQAKKPENRKVHAFIDPSHDVPTQEIIFDRFGVITAVDVIRPELNIVPADRIKAHVGSDKWQQPEFFAPALRDQYLQAIAQALATGATTTVSGSIVVPRSGGREFPREVRFSKSDENHVRALTVIVPASKSKPNNNLFKCCGTTRHSDCLACYRAGDHPFLKTKTGSEQIPSTTKQH